jgi:hypothetical protein
MRCLCHHEFLFAGKTYIPQGFQRFRLSFCSPEKEGSWLALMADG